MNQTNSIKDYAPIIEHVDSVRIFTSIMFYFIVLFVMIYFNGIWKFLVIFFDEDYSFFD